MSKRADILEMYPDNEFILLEGEEMDAALVGVCRRFGQPEVLAYDLEKILDIFVEQGMTREDAVDFFEFNTIGAWMGDLTPVFIQRLDEQDSQ